jgi:hypothetical protein
MEAEYVLEVLYRMRDEASANPQLYGPDAQKQIEVAIARVSKVLRDTRLTICSAEQNVTAA